MNEDKTAEIETSYDSPDFISELTTLLNRYSKENNSNTPDFILSKYLINCLNNFDQTVNRRSEWYGRHDEPGKTMEITL